MVNVNDPSLNSWLKVPENSDFPIQNLPFGIFNSVSNPKKRVGVAIGEYVIDMAKLQTTGLFDEIYMPYDVFSMPYLNDFIDLGKPITNKVRNKIAEFLSQEQYKDRLMPALVPMEGVNMHMPVRVGDYTDFYSSMEHATNVGKMFRDPENALLPNWKHLPVGYHGRSSSIVVSGTPLHRPKGQTKNPDQELPQFGPSQRMDFELEMAFITCGSTKLGESISTEKAEEHIFGFVLFNDWSARDIQVWEYVPLGPFLAKNFESSISPWVVTLEALAPFRVAGPKQDPPVLPYLQYSGDRNFDIQLEVGIKPDKGEETVVCRSNFKYMYWNVCQQLAHQTINGCNINTGDMYASGTISGPTEDSYGSMLELAWKGTKPLKLKDGSTRSFIHDGDTVIMRGHAESNGIRIGFGEVKTKVLPAK
jgi:fumarylacetoacetase